MAKVRQSYAAVNRKACLTDHDYVIKVLVDGAVRRPYSDAMDDALKTAIDAAGGPAALGKILGITSQAISQWDRVPAERVIAVERATGGRVPREALRPDLYPDAA